MKTKPAILKLITALLMAFVTTAAFGQATFTWFGSGNQSVFDQAANWTTNGTTAASAPPSPAIGDTAQWDGVSSNIFVRYTGSTPAFSGNPGCNFVLTANQNNQVDFAYSTSGNFGLNNVTVTGPGGQFVLGSVNGVVSNITTEIVPRPNGATHDFVNNSTTPAVVYGNVRWQAGGGAVYTLVFDGSGDWLVTNDLRNANGTGILLAKLGTGKWTWNGPSIGVAAGSGTINNPVTLAQGPVLFKWANANMNNVQIVNSGDILQFDADGQSQTYAGVMSGTAPFMVSAGTVTLSAQNTFSGNLLLTNTGTVIANGTENAGVSGPLGEGNIISFNGGTLQWSSVNSFDYSSRFDTSANQQYNLGTGGQSVTLATALASSGGTLTKTNPGTLTLAGANSYSGATTVSAGKLVFQGAMTGAGSITVANSAALGVTENGGQVQPATLTVGTSSGATLEFNNVTNTSAAPLAAAGAISAGAPITVNINSGAFNAIGQVFPLFSWGSGSAPAVVNPPTVSGAAGILTTNTSVTPNRIELTITTTPYVWTGTNNSTWDTNVFGNWVQSGNQVIWSNTVLTLFNDSASNSTVNISGVLQPSSVTVNNSALSYSIASSSGNDIAGSTSLTKSGSGTLTLSGGFNAYTGVTTIGGGTVSVGALANGGAASDIGAAANSAGNLVFNGGTLSYTGGATTSDHLFTINTGGGTVDSSGSGAIYLSNVGSIAAPGSGTRALTLTGTLADTNTFASVLSDSAGGATALTKSGTGTWILTGTNTYSGGTTINQGILQIGASPSGTLGTGPTVDNGTLIFKRSNILTNTGSISGNGTVVVGGGGTVILTGNNTWVGGTSISNGTTLQIANGGAGSIALNSPIINNGMLIFNSSTPITVRGGNAIISGTGNIEDKGSGLVMCVGLNTYTGWVQIDAGATFQPFIGNEGALVASAITNNGTLKLVAQDSAPPTRSYAGNIVGTGRVWKDDNNQNPGEVALLGTNTYTGGTLISGGGIVLGDGTNLGSITGNVTFTNTAVDDTASRSLQFDRPDVYTFAGNIIGAALTNGSPNQGNLGRVVQLGTGVVILTGNNTYPGGTLISNGVVQVGNGGTTGSIGGPAGVNLNEPSGNCGIVFDRSNNVLFSNNIAGNGRVVQFGSGILTLSNYMPNIGPMTVSNGTLVISGSQLLGGALNVSGGTIVAGGLSQISTLTVSNNMTISSGTVFAEINKSQGQSNTLYNVLGSSSATGGAILVSNLGPSIVAGDQYFLFSGAVSGGGALSVTGGGVTWSNNTANDGSIIALTSGSGGVIPTVKARITSMSISGANVVLNGTNGVNNGIYYLLDTTDVAQPIGQWIAVATNIVSTNGSATSGFTFTGTNVVTPNAGKQFYILSNTNNH